MRDNQANIAPKVVFLAGSDKATYLQKTEEAVHTHQNDQLAIDVAVSFAMILWKALEGSSLEEAIEARTLLTKLITTEKSRHHKI